MIQSEIQEQELLDAIDPLRHFRVDDETLLPAQPQSTERQIKPVGFGSLTLKLMVDAGPGCGGIAWPAGEVLSQYLVHRGQEYLHGRRVLELGSGTGLVGLVAAKLGASGVVMTDQLPLLDIMNQNISLNNLQDRVSSLELDWGKGLPSLGQIDLILAADCVYFEPSFPLLVQTLADLTQTADKNCDILFCYKQRRKADKRFFVLLKKHFTWINVDDDPESHIYKREAISLLKLVPKPKSGNNRA